MPKANTASGSGTGRLGRGRRVATSLSEINVVPLVDVMLVLLIIFMVTAPMIQRGIDVNLPVATRASRIEGDRVVVTITPAYRQSRMVFLNEELIRVDVLQERVRQKMATLTSKQVYLRGDGTLLYQELMDVFDRLKAAGVERVGLETKAPGER
jgi:biopolymer transport protein TolR